MPWNPLEVSHFSSTFAFVTFNVLVVLVLFQRFTPMRSKRGLADVLVFWAGRSTSLRRSTANGVTYDGTRRFARVASHTVGLLFSSFDRGRSNWLSDIIAACMISSPRSKIIVAPTRGRCKHRLIELIHGCTENLFPCSSLIRVV